MMRRSHLRILSVVGVLALAALMASVAQALGADAAPSSASAGGATQESATKSSRTLTAMMADWPTQYTVTGTKSEPQYVEHITLTRRGDLFGLRIEIASQGSDAGGGMTALVRVAADGRVSWLAGCTGQDCADDPAVRGYLAGAAMLSAERRGVIPTDSTLRLLGSHPVVCVPDRALYPDSDTTGGSAGANASAGPDLAPCFSLATGAVLGQYSHVDATFAGPTMASGSITEIDSADADLLTTPPES